MPRLIKFRQEEYTLPDYLNPAHLRRILFQNDGLATLEMSGGQDFVVSHQEANRIIAEINGEEAPSVIEQALKDAFAEDIVKDTAAWAPERTQFVAPEQPDISLAAFKAMIRADNFVVLDTETTGLGDGEIVQIAILGCNNVVLLDTLVKPREPIPASATAIHGITNEMVADAPTWETVRKDVFYAIAGRHCVVYNAVYDRKMMHQSAERWGMVKLDWKEYGTFWCAMEAFAEIYGEWNEYRGNFKWQKLETAARHYKIAIDGTAHTALTDCRTTLAVCKAMAGA